MSDDIQFGGASHLAGDSVPVSQWLRTVFMQESQAPSTEPLTSQHDSQVVLALTDDYHPSFYQQLPDFVMAVLTDVEQAASAYAPVLFHLAGCHECHQAYLDLYDSMQAALQPIEPRPILGQGTRTLSATPHRMLSHFCQSLISQADAAVRQARHDHTDGTDAARLLLQLALKVSAHITQSSLRRQALADLVKVASSCMPAASEDETQPSVRSYTPSLVAGSGHVRRAKVLRRADSALKPHTQEAVSIPLQSQALEGQIVQNGSMLELHLQDLDSILHGSHVSISILLGALLEPVRWLGGNPLAIRSSVPVDEQGKLITPLGSTDLQMTNPEDRNLLEAMFMLLEVRQAI